MVIDPGAPQIMCVCPDAAVCRRARRPAQMKVIEIAVARAVKTCLKWRIQDKARTRR